MGTAWTLGPYEFDPCDNQPNSFVSEFAESGNGGFHGAVCEFVWTWVHFQVEIFPLIELWVSRINL